MKDPPYSQLTTHYSLLTTHNSQLTMTTAVKDSK